MSDTAIKAKNKSKPKTTDIRKLTVTAILSAVSAVLMFLSFSVPLVPSFIKFDFSDLPALIASFSMGPLSGVAVCLIKNAINLFFTKTAGVGELSNFIIGCAFVLPAGLIYKHNKTRKGALIASATGAVSSAVLCFFSNLFLIYPAYIAFIIPLDVLMKAYTSILPSVEKLWQAILIFNVPFTFVKSACSVAITFIIYKYISPILKGKKI